MKPFFHSAILLLETAMLIFFIDLWYCFVAVCVDLSTGLCVCAETKCEQSPADNRSNHCTVTVTEARKALQLEMDHHKSEKAMNSLKPIFEENK